MVICSLKTGKCEERIQSVKGQVDAIVGRLCAALEFKILAHAHRAIHVEVEGEGWRVEVDRNIWRRGNGHWLWARGTEFPF